MKVEMFDIIMCIIFGIIVPTAAPLAIWLIEKLNDRVADSCKKNDSKGAVEK